MEFIEIEVLKWSKHQRKDVKKPSWFALSNRILEDAKLFDLEDAECKALIYIFCQASQQGVDIVKIYFAHASKVCGLSKKTMLSAISRLCNADVTRASLERHADVTPQDRTGHYKTLQDKTVTAAPPAVAPVNIALNSEIWKSYCDAYFDRYSTEPVRNAKINGQIAQLAKRLGSEAPDVVRFYVGHNKSFYVSKLHEIGICLSDAESLRTQWATGNKVTSKQASQADDTATLDSQLKRIREGKL